MTTLRRVGSGTGRRQPRTATHHGRVRGPVASRIAVRQREVLAAATAPSGVVGGVRSKSNRRAMATKNLGLRWRNRSEESK